MNQNTIEAVSVFDAATEAQMAAARQLLSAIVAELKAAGKGTALQIITDKYEPYPSAMLVVGTAAPTPLYEIDEAMSSAAEAAAIILGPTVSPGETITITAT